MTTITGIGIAISAKHDTLNRDLSAAKNSVSRFAHDVSSIISEGFAGGFETIAGLFERAFSIAEESYTKLNSLKAHAQTFDSDVKSMQELEYIAAQAGIPIETMNVGLRQLEKNVSNAVRGLGPARKSFEDLGLSARQIAEMPLVEKVMAITTAIHKMADETKHAGVAYGIFREYGVRMMGVVGEDMPKLIKQFEDLGIAITHDDEKVIIMARSASTNFGMIWEGFKNKLSIPILRALSSIIEQFNAMIVSSGGLKILAQEVGTAIVYAMNRGEHAVYALIDAFARLKFEMSDKGIGSGIASIYHSIVDTTVLIGQSIGNGIGRLKILGEMANEDFDKGKKSPQDTIDRFDKNEEAMGAPMENKFVPEKHTYMTDKPYEVEKNKLDLMLSPFSAVIEGATSVMQKLQEASEAKVKKDQSETHAQDDLIKGMQKAAKEADTWLKNPKFSKAGQSVIDDDIKEQDSKNRDTPQYFKDDFLDAYKSAKSVDPLDKQGMAMLADKISLLHKEIYAEQRDHPRAGSTDRMESMAADMDKYFKELQISKAPKVNLHIIMTLNEDLSKIIKVGNTYTDDQTAQIMTTIESAISKAASSMSR